MCFVWITGLRGPCPQIWIDEPVDGNGKPRKETIFKIKLSDGEEKQSLDYLMIDRVALALSHPDIRANDFKTMARAVIEAMREPTKQMNIVGTDEWPNHYKIWTKMIDCSLNDQS